MRLTLGAQRARGIDKTSAPKRAWGMPGAQCPRSLVCAVVVQDAHEYSLRSHRKSPGIPARNGFNGFVRSLPGDRAFLSPSSLRSLLLKNLTPASRRQDHTILPSASGAVRQKRRRGHRIPPRVRDDREPPLCVGRDDADIELIWSFGKPEYFFRRG